MPENYLYRVTGVRAINGWWPWQTAGKIVQRDYVSSLVEEGRPSGFNAVQLAREEHIAPTKVKNLGVTDKPIDRRLIGFDPDRQYEHSK